MANPTADPKAAPLADELKEYALTLAPSAYPKNFFCASCSELAIDSWKLLCCNKAICSSCHAKLAFPTTCPLCEHTPLEADLCTPNKALRNTMRVWLQKQKKKDEAKSTSQVGTPVESTPAATDTQATAESVDKAVETIEGATNVEERGEQRQTALGDVDADAAVAPDSAAPESEETSKDGAQDVETEGTQNPTESAEAIVDPNAPPKTADGQADAAYGNNAMFNNMNGMNGMPGQFGFGFPNQGNFNGMGFNGMNPMGGMPNMMANGGWNNMNPMDFNMNMANMPNGMYGGFGGNMGMPVNDMMNFGGGYGNGWQGGMNGGYENFNGFNPMGAYNQSGAQYPQMMNQFPKNNFQNQNRFPTNGAAFPQQKNDRRGSHGNFGNKGPGFQQNAHSRPGSRSGPPHNSEGDAPGAGAAEGDASEVKAEGEQPEASIKAPQEGKPEGDGATDSGTSPAAQAEGEANESKELTETAEASHDISQTNAPALNPIQTVDSVDGPLFEQPMMNNMPPMQPYGPGMMGGFPAPGPNMNMPYGGNMGFNNHHNNYGSSGGFNGAYGAATVVVGEPRGLGVEGAPTGPRAMREGRPNTGFSSRMNNIRYNSHTRTATPSVTSQHEAAAASPARRGRGSPERDEALRTKERSPSRSRSGGRDDERRAEKERSRSEDRAPKEQQRERSMTPAAMDDERYRDRRHHRSSRYDDYDDRRDARDGDYDDRRRDDRDDRGDRTRSASVESKYRSRRDKDKYRSSRSHRDRSREHRHRHRSRSHSPGREEQYEEDAYANGMESKSRSRRHRSDKDDYRERERDRSRDRDRDRDRRDRRDRDHDRDYEYEREKERSREKDRDRKRSRRDREEDPPEERDYVEEKYHSSRRSREKRDRERDRDYETEQQHSTQRAVSPPLNAPTGPSADKAEGFSIKGFSKTRRTDSTSKPMPPPPTGPRGFQPPKGPAADRDRDHRDSGRDHRRKASISSTPATPTSPSAQDHYAAEREKHTRERVDKDNRDRVLQSIHGRATGRSNSITLSSKRSRDEVDREEQNAAPAEDNRTADKDRESSKIPTGPSAHRDKRRKSGDNAIASLFTAGLRKQAKGRRGGVKTEGDAERELERVEREREKERERRW